LKKLTKFILLSFIGPFILTFFIAVFVLLMQFIWLYVDDMLGKGIEWYVIAELLFFSAANVVPLALPLSVLLASLMTFGNLGEHFELVSFKSAGISLQRIMRPLAIFVLCVCVGAFVFSNYLMPVANLKFYSLLHDIRSKKPAVDIKPGVFY
jgi:lipopolysaccharide export system permease protein